MSRRRAEPSPLSQFFDVRCAIEKSQAAMFLLRELHSGDLLLQNKATAADCEQHAWCEEICREALARALDEAEEQLHKLEKGPPAAGDARDR